MNNTTKFLREKGMLKKGYKKFVINGDFGVILLNDLLTEYLYFCYNNQIIGKCKNVGCCDGDVVLSKTCEQCGKEH